LVMRQDVNRSAVDRSIESIESMENRNRRGDNGNALFR